MARYAALLDACALVPIVLADTLLRVAERGLYRPLWSQAVLEEARAAVLHVHPDVDAVAVANRFRDMTETFEDAMVTGWEPLVDGIDLPDPTTGTSSRPRCAAAHRRSLRSTSRTSPAPRSTRST